MKPGSLLPPPPPCQLPLLSDGADSTLGSSFLNVGSVSGSPVLFGFLEHWFFRLVIDVVLTKRSVVKLIWHRFG